MESQLGGSQRTHAHAVSSFWNCCGVFWAFFANRNGNLLLMALLRYWSKRAPEIVVGGTDRGWTIFAILTWNDLNMISFYPRKLDWWWIRRHVRFSGSCDIPLWPHPTVVSSTQPAALVNWTVFDGQVLQEWLDEFPLLTWHLHQCYSPMAESWGLKLVEDLLTSNYNYII